jgi:hypothetical protein
MKLTWQQNLVKSYLADGRIKFFESAAYTRLIPSAIIRVLVMELESISDTSVDLNNLTALSLRGCY